MPTHKILGNMRLSIRIGLLGLADCALFASLLDSGCVLVEFAGLHVGAVAELALFVLVVGIVGSIWSALEMIVTSNDIVVW